MQKVRLTLALAAGALLATAATSFAVIDNSHHDGQKFLGATAESKCMYCHGIKWTPPTTDELTNYGTVGSMCVSRCHTATGLFGDAHIEGAAALIADGSYRAPQSGPNYVSSVIGSSHPVAGTRGNHSNAAWVTAPDTNVAMIATTWPYTSSTWLGAAGHGIQCTSCHAVHDNDRGAPFLWEPMGTGTVPAAATADAAFCQKCHNMRSTVAPTDGDLTSAIAATGDAHPVEMKWVPTTASTRGTAAAQNAHVRRARSMTMASYAGNHVYDVAYSTSGQNNWDTAKDATHYTVGGHTGNMLTTGVATNDRIGCYSCHSAHPGTGTNQLLLAPRWTNAGASSLCGGCHANAGNANNPGASAWYHPVNSDAVAVANSSNDFYFNTSIGGFLVAVNFPIYNYSEGTESGIPLAANNGLVCSSCHDMHGAQKGYMAIRVIDSTSTPNQTGAYAATKKVCAACHTGKEHWGWNSGKSAPVNSQTGAQAEMHHLTFEAAYPSNGDYAEPSWQAAFGVGMDGTAVIGGANLDCADCHVFNGTAHNW